jgi:hypothetical protein
MAAAAGVVVKPDEYFGFETYAREGPIFPSAEKVREQSRVGEMVLGCLFQAKPERLLGVKRERVEPSAVGGNHQVTDYFALAPGLSLRRPDEIETVALRLEFRGETPVLRDFLNALARAPELLVVRSVEVTTPEQKAAGNAGRSGDSTGFVAGPKPSQFAVIVEAVKPAAGPVSVQP